MTVPEPNLEPSPAAPVSSPPARPRRTAPGILLAGLALVVAIAALLVGSLPFWAPQLVPAPPENSAPTDDIAAELRAAQDRLSGDETKLTALGARLAVLEARPAPAPALPTAAFAPWRVPPPTAAPPTQSPETAAAIKSIKDQLATLAGQSAATGDRLAKLEGSIASAGEQGRADRSLLLALANLRAAVEGSGPFAAELAAVQALAAGRPEVRQGLAPLAADASAGLPSLASLAERFDRGVAPAILRARGSGKSESWRDQILARLERLVVVRRIAPGGPAPRDATEAAVARADAALKAGDLARAVGALDPLHGASAEAAAPWLAEARKRVTAEADLAKLWQAESARLAAGAGAGAGAKP